MTDVDPIAGEPIRLTRRRVLGATGAVGAGLLAGCSGDDASGTGSEESSSDNGDDGVEEPTDEESMDGGDDSADEGSMDGTESEWRSIELTTVRGGETFTIDDFDGPVVIQSFAVWCPKCKQQSRIIADLDDSITRVGLNTDPNEDAEKVRQHAEDNGFDWRFAVAPTEMTESLIEEFGSVVTNAPSTPVIVTCPDGGTEFMSGSVNPVEEIEAAAEC